MFTPPPADAMQPPQLSRPSAAAAFDDDPLPALDPLELDLDETKMKLPTFDEYRKGPAKQLPTDGGSYVSKLPGINQGRSAYDDVMERKKEDEKPPLEKLVFNLTWFGIAFLVAVEIFINTPWFQQIKPAILNFLADGANVVQ